MYLAYSELRIAHKYIGTPAQGFLAEIKMQGWRAS